MKKNLLKKIAHIVVYLLAVIGLVFVVVFFAMQWGLLNVRGSSIDRNASLGVLPKTESTSNCLAASASIVAVCDWNSTAEWAVTNGGLLKDAALLQDVSQKTNVSERMIAAAVIPEQLRFFTSNRESFKRYFEPLKILSSLTKFSLGVAGIKTETAKRIEMYATDPASVFYPGEGYAELLAYAPGVDVDTERYNRLTDSKNHYYSYLYTAIYLKEIETQWHRAGFDVSDRPDVLVTLFNLGFDASHPNASPKIAGSLIALGGKSYHFGELGTLFYHSKELETL